MEQEAERLEALLRRSQAAAGSGGGGGGGGGSVSLPQIGRRAGAKRIDVGMAQGLATRQLDRFHSTSGNFAAHLGR